MSIYVCKDSSCPIERVEFTPRGSGNMAFISLNDSSRMEEVQKTLASSDLEQNIITTTKINGRSILVTNGPRSQADVVSVLSRSSPLHKEPPHKASVNPWAVRAILGIAGQTLVLTSSFLSKKVDKGTAFFAASNLMANAIAITYGANKEEDLHRLKHVKSGMNNYFHDIGVDNLPPAEGHDATDVLKEPVRLNSLQKANKFIESYAAQLSIGLRYFGAFNLARSGFNSEKVMELTKQGRFKQALNQLEVKDPLIMGAAAGTLAGKTMAMASNTVNPYDPKKASWLDRFREKFFITSALIEATAFGALAYQGFAKRKIKINGKEYRDFIRGTGSLLFVAAYISRTFASFEKHVTDMDEVYAHIADGLAHAPKEQVDQIIANTAAMVTDHFKDEHLNFGEVYDRLADDLYKYHGVALASYNPSQKAAADTEEAKESVLTADQSKKDDTRAFANSTKHAPSSNIYLDRIYKSPHVETHIS